MHIYIYIYREREREREIYTHTHTYMHKPTPLAREDATFFRQTCWHRFVEVSGPPVPWVAPTVCVFVIVDESFISTSSTNITQLIES